MVLSMQVQLVRLQEQHDHTRQALDRAFSTIRDTRARSDDTENKVIRMLSFVRGGAAVGAVLFAFTQWYVLEQLAALQQVVDRVSAIDRRVISIEARTLPVEAGGPK